MNYHSKKHESRHNAVNAIHYFIDDIEENGLSLNDRVSAISPLGNYYGIRVRDKYLNNDHEIRLVKWVAQQTEPNQNFDKIISLCRQLSPDDLNLIVKKSYNCDGLINNHSNFRNVVYAIKKYYPQYINKIDFLPYFDEYMSIIDNLPYYGSADYWHVVDDNYGSEIIKNIISMGLLTEYVKYINNHKDDNYNILLEYFSTGLEKHLKSITVGDFVEYYHLPPEYSLGVIL